MVARNSVSCSAALEAGAHALVRGDRRFWVEHCLGALGERAQASLAAEL
jgi:hypothetical protein